MRLFSSINKFLFGRKMIIFDDVFPYLLTGFRITEYNYYLGKFKKVEIYSSTQKFYKYKAEYENVYPELAKFIKKFDPKKRYPCSLIYTIFLNNAYDYLSVIERSQTPFIFTLYPGGGFCLNDKVSDEKLKTVCSSEYLKKIIVTQINTKNYLIENNFCTPDKIEFIYGGVLPSDYYKKNFVPKKYYKKEKNTLDICFVACKYMEKGLDKGYDVFIDVAKKVSKKFPDIFFHIVGGFTKDCIDVREIDEKIKFYGIQYRDFFPQFYSRMDMIISPNIPFKLLPGSFDGFPTGSCIEAGLAGVAVLCTDELNLNIAFKNNKEIFIINRSVDDIAGVIANFRNNTNELYNLSKNCKEAFYREFDLYNQIKGRVNILNHYIAR